MTLTTTDHKPAKPLWKRALSWVGVIAFTLILLFCIAYVLLWGGFDFGKKRLSFTESCGDYRLLYYLTEKGNGHIDYVDKSGKVYGQYPMTPQTDSSAIWDKDCKGIWLGIGDGAKRLEALK